MEFGAKRVPGHLLSIQKADVRSLGARRRRRRRERQAKEGGKGGGRSLLVSRAGSSRAACKRQVSRAYLLLTCLLFPLPRAGGSM